MILTAERQFKRMRTRGALRPLKWMSETREVIKPVGTNERIVVCAVVNAGRWVAECPWCNSAQVVSRIDPWFYCADCCNMVAGNLMAAVVFPDDADEIERVLLCRPDLTTRNALLGETATMLLAENVAHGVGSLVVERVTLPRKVDYSQFSGEMADLTAWQIRKELRPAPPEPKDE